MCGILPIYTFRGIMLVCPMTNTSTKHERRMQRTFVYKLRPTRGQAYLLAQTLQTCRHLYNDCLAQRKQAWEERQESLCFAVQSVLKGKAERGVRRPLKRSGRPAAPTPA